MCLEVTQQCERVDCCCLLVQGSDMVRFEQPALILPKLSSPLPFFLKPILTLVHTDLELTAVFLLWLFQSCLSELFCHSTRGLTDTECLPLSLHAVTTEHPGRTAGYISISLWCWEILMQG